MPIRKKSGKVSYAPRIYTLCDYFSSVLTGGFSLCASGAPHIYIYNKYIYIYIYVWLCVYGCVCVRVCVEGGNHTL